MQNKNENGIKWISCDNLGELVEEFKKFRNSKSANERKGYSFGGIGGLMSMVGLRTVELPNGEFAASEIIDSIKIYQENRVDLSLNVAPLNFKEVDWKPYDQKIKKILKEIWETGEVKDYQGLDLSWPTNNQLPHVFCDQCHKYIGDSRKLVYFSNAEKNLDFCSESCHSKYKKRDVLEEENDKLKGQLKKEKNSKIIWMVIAIATVSAFTFTLFFGWRKKIKKLKKR